MKRRIWNRSEIRFLEDNFKNQTTEEMAQILDRSPGSVSRKLNKLGFYKNWCVDRKSKSKEHTSIRYKYNVYRHNAKKRNLPMNISFEHFEMLVLLDCFYCGAKPSEHNVYKARKDVLKETIQKNKVYLNGVDRINSFKGYEVGNCVPCCTYCNFVKRQTNYRDFIDHAYRIVEQDQRLQAETGKPEKSYDD